MKKLIRKNKALYTGAQEPASRRRCGFRSLLVLTCTGVSFAHGGNDGQKGMGLIMLILIGAAPTAYALNRTMPDSGDTAFPGQRHAASAQQVFVAHAGTARRSG